MYVNWVDFGYHSNLVPCASLILSVRSLACFMEINTSNLSPWDCMYVIVLMLVSM